MLLVRSVHFRSSAQMAFVLGGFLGEDVALNACVRLILPPERILKRLAALRLVFIWALHDSCFGMATGGSNGALSTSAPLLLKPAAALGRNLRFRFFLEFLLGFLFYRLLDFLLPFFGPTP